MREKASIYGKSSGRQGNLPQKKKNEERGYASGFEIARERDEGRAKTVRAGRGLGRRGGDNPGKTFLKNTKKKGPVQEQI